MFPSKRKLLNMLINLESKENPSLEKSKNSEKKLDMNKSQEKLLSLTTMPLNISDNTFLNISQKNRLNMLPEKEKLKNMNTSQLKDKLFTILNNLLKPNLEPVKEDMPLLPMRLTLFPEPLIMYQVDPELEKPPPQTLNMFQDLPLTQLVDTSPVETLIQLVDNMLLAEAPIQLADNMLLVDNTLQETTEEALMEQLNTEQFQVQPQNTEQ
eukprot:TRINITY_DN6414_c0_g2_i1.p1 TRINITY_DN6414_c0_g2~~TRINITY_DN6414_c0_g2_i1.p1  ORF type:complete len:211 (+),score=18.67 TRINITY_DN6414_c0_g2_i1:532-1164(+)